MPKNQDQIIDFAEPEWVFPYTIMELGDSFFMPTVRPAYAHYIVDLTSKRVGLRVKTFTVVEDGILGVRVWRVA